MNQLATMPTFFCHPLPSGLIYLLYFLSGYPLQEKTNIPWMTIVFYEVASRFYCELSGPMKHR